MKEFRADAALIGTGPTFVNRRAQIIALATHYAIPTIYARREYVADGGLISYSPPVTEAYRQVESMRDESSKVPSPQTFRSFSRPSSNWP